MTLIVAGQPRSALNALEAAGLSVPLVGQQSTAGLVVVQVGARATEVVGGAGQVNLLSLPFCSSSARLVNPSQEPSPVTNRLAGYSFGGVRAPETNLRIPGLVSNGGGVLRLLGCVVKGADDQQLWLKILRARMVRSNYGSGGYEHAGGAEHGLRSAGDSNWDLLAARGCPISDLGRPDEYGNALFRHAGIDIVGGGADEMVEVGGRRFALAELSSGGKSVAEYLGV